MTQNIELNIHQLRVFVAVVEQRSFTGAARQLHLTQPAVSMQVSRLQRSVNVPLLIRDGRSLIPTEVGLTVYRHACEVLAATDTLRRVLEDMEIERVQHISIGTTPAYAEQMVPRLLARFQRTHPTIRITLVQATGTELIERVRQNQVDAAIVRAQRPLDDAEATLLGMDEALLFDSPHYPVSPNPFLTLPQLASAPFIRRFTGRDLTTVWLDNLLAREGLTLANVVLTLSTWEGVKQAVREGAGLALSLRSILRNELESGEFRELRLAGDQDSRPVYLITSPDRSRGMQPVAFRELISAIRDDLPTERFAAPQPDSNAD
jgi:LysR family transcriptional regulator, transcriptional activator of the cysJI operon